jgi:uncharacterized protein Yka (UPF0111/DUF47 family)
VNFFAKKLSGNEFVAFFQEHVSLCVVAIDELGRIFGCPPDARSSQIEDLEHRGDEIVKKTIRLLDKTYIPPYDKSDILNLISHVDDILDSMKSIERNVRIYQLSGTNRLAQSACDVARNAVEQLNFAIRLLPNFDAQAIRAAAAKINELEDQADDVRDSALSELFQDPGAPVTGRQIGWQKTYQLLEELTDHCQHAVDALLSISRKEGC